MPFDTPKDWVSAFHDLGRDPAVDPILRGEETRSIVRIALTDGGAAAHKAYQERNRSFGGDLAWAAPTEFELRNACRQLQDDKRFEDAVETCRLSTVVHPEIWNSWYNLGKALIAAGRRPLSVPYFACVLKLDQLNWNGKAIRRLIEEFRASPDQVPAGCTP
jgi:hypothetical protein